ncbi:hypothetical protein FXO38_05971 [Capsicum annuum]|nr:hypothetical protein FXO37_24090 [Capsicum annuum]KAF3672698.1 hypothetical protein FXO38_05971 [Capsicum annuum]
MFNSQPTKVRPVIATSHRPLLLRRLGSVIGTLVRNEYDLTTTATTSIIPVDLNAFLLKPSDVTSGPVSPMDARRPRNDSDPNDSR